MTKETDVYTLEEFEKKVDEISEKLEKQYAMKTKPFLNEVQLQLNHHSELIERAFYFKQLNVTEYTIYKNMFEDFKKSADDYLNDLRGVKND